MPKLINEAGGIRYLEGLRSPSSRSKEHDTEAKKIAIDLPDVPMLTSEDNPEKWDVVFVCSDGIVFAHRLIISASSKYIMGMFDDQPPWYTTYIHLLDLPRKIVQLLVDLSYTGEMRLTEAIRDDVLDAMHCLGWVHTDCLSADYDVPADESYGDQQQGTDISTNKSPPKKGDALVAKNEDDSKISAEEGMSTTSSATKLTVSDKRETRRGRPPGKTKSQIQDDENSVPKKNQQKKESDTPPPSASSTIRKSGRRSSSFSETNESAPASGGGRGSSSSTTNNNKSDAKVSKSSPAEEEKLKKGKQVKAEANLKKTPVAKTPIKKKKIETTPKPTNKPKTRDILADDDDDDDEDASSQVSSIISDNNSLIDSPSKRQRRKPKRFEEYEELDKPKPRASPVKPTTSTTAPPPTTETTKKVQKGKKAELSSSDAINGSTNNKDESTAGSSQEVQIVVQVPKTTPTLKVKESGRINNSKAKGVPKKKQPETTTTTTPKHSLITAYFSKKDSKTEEEESSSDLSQGCIEIIEQPDKTSKTMEESLPKLDGENMNNDDMMKTISGLRKRTASEQDTDTDTDTEMPTLTDEKQDNNSKKRSFDEIRSSHIEEQSAAEATTTDPRPEENGDESGEEIKPARKSSRVASKAQSTEENEGKNGEDVVEPKRKRSRNEESTDISKDPSSPALPTRRSSKQ